MIVRTWVHDADTATDYTCQVFFRSLTWGGYHFSQKKLAASLTVVFTVILSIIHFFFSLVLTAEERSRVLHDKYP